jgi:glycosyltransferase involved in cell wall biosynthesis
LTSLINQTLKDIEIICVDDGSTDNSLQIVKNFSSKDSRIIILEQENKKQGAARNYGLTVATGEYIGYVDSDDWVEADYFEKLYNVAKKYNSDIAVTNILKHKKFYNKYNVHYKNVKAVTNIGDKIKLCGDVKGNFFYAWNKIYKADLLKNNDIKFEEQHVYEDVIFAIKAIFYANSVVSVPDTKYHYIQNQNSTINKKGNDLQKYQDVFIAFKNLQDFCNVQGIILPERLNYYTSEKINPFVKRYIGEYKEKDMLFGIFQINKKFKTQGVA